MIRWNFLLPRLLVLAVLVGLFLVSKDWVLHGIVQRTASRANRAPVEFGTVFTQIRSGRLVVANVQVARQDNPAQNLVECKQADAKLDLWSLSLGKYLADVRLEGLRFGTPHRTGPARFDLPLDWLIDVAGDYLPDLSLPHVPGPGTPDFDLSQLVDYRKLIDAEIEKTELESPAVAAQLKQRWTQQYEQQQGRIAEIRGRIQQLQQLVQGFNGNVFQQVQVAQQAAEQVQVLTQQIPQVRFEIQNLNQLARQDAVLIDGAGRRDYERIKTRIKQPVVNAQELSEYLLGESTREQVRKVLLVIQLVRKFLPVNESDPSASRGVGRIVNFNVQPALPNWLVRSAYLQGQADLAGSPLDFHGELKNFTREYQRSGKPIELRLQGQGPAKIWIEAQMVRHEAVPVDRIVLVGQEIALPARRLGKGDGFWVDVPASVASAHLQVELKGETLAGTLRFQQPNLQVSPGSNKPEVQAWVAQLSQGMGNFKQCEVTVNLSGTPTAPQLALNSNLGPEVAQQLQTMLAQQSAYLEEQLALKMQHVAEEQMAAAQQFADGQAAQLLAGLDLEAGQLDQLKTVATRQIPALGKFLR